MGTLFKHQFHFITLVDGSPFDHPGIDPTMTSHGIIPAGAQIFFHSTTGVTKTGHFQHYLSNAEFSFFKGKQINSGNHDITTDQARIYPVFLQDFGHSLQMLGLEQGDLSVS